jgi:acyl-CoA reductase-like NAD-dependent aldehyde dehydrogenase
MSANFIHGIDRYYNLGVYNAGQNAPYKSYIVEPEDVMTDVDHAILDTSTGENLIRNVPVDEFGDRVLSLADIVEMNKGKIIIIIDHTCAKILGSDKPQHVVDRASRAVNRYAKKGGRTRKKRKTIRKIRK